MIKKLAFYDFDNTLVISPEPDSGRLEWSEKKGEPYPHIGWWGRPESLDTEVFDIKFFESTLNLLKKDIADPNTYTIILTSRMEKLREQVERVLKTNGINVDEVNLKNSYHTKGQKILQYIPKFPDLERIDVYDDNYEREIASFVSIRNEIPENIKFNIFHVENGKFNLIERTYRMLNIIHEEIEKLNQ